MDVIKAGGIAAVPDTAGFSSDADRTAGLKALYPLSDGNSHVHAGASLAASIKISKDAGYKGLYSIATEPGAGDPAAATKAILDEIVKLI